MSAAQRHGARKEFRTLVSLDEARRLAAELAPRRAVELVDLSAALDRRVARDGVAPRDVAVASRPGGAPQVSLHGAATEAARRVDIEQVTVSITHKGGLVAAVAMGW